MSDGATYPDSFGPYLRYGISTDFENFVFRDKEPRSLFFLIKFNEAGLATDFADDLKQLDDPQNPEFEVEFGPDEEDSQHVTMIADKAVVLDTRTFTIWDNYVSKVELSLPIKPTRRKRVLHEVLSPRFDDGQRPPGKLLIGVLDDGCPFAAAQFLTIAANGGPGTRVRAIWDQNQGRQPIEIDKAGTNYFFGQKLQDFNFGLEYRRDSVGQQIGLDEWIQRHLITPQNSIDEDGCYADADFRRLASRISHGAHVMDVIAGRIPTSSRVGPPWGSGKDHRDPPTWAVGTDPASSAEIVFVQFPLDCIRDSTGVWLKAYAIRGIRYILSCADPQNTTDVIVNLSYGPTTGPHDGTADVETALAELVTEFDGSAGKLKLQVFLAAGNSYLLDGHVRFVRHMGDPNHIEWIWRLPPDNTVLCFAEVWMDVTHPGSITVTVTPPGGGTSWAASPVPMGTSTMWRLNVDPTVIAPNVAAAPHGDYTIKVDQIPRGAKVDAYVARSDPNMGVVTGAKLSRFVDPKWEQTRAAEESCIYAKGEFDNSGSRVHRLGTLNGIATDTNASVHVAGGYVAALLEGRKTPYASAGPARAPSTRKGPDYAMYCDESYALEGVRAGGTRSGAVFRLIGTSAAAPQLARLIADKASLQVDFPTTTAQEKEQRGEGDVEPP